MSADGKTPAVGHRGRSAHHVGDPLPAVMLLGDLARVLGLGSSQAWQLERAGELERFELPRVGKRVRYSGKKVQAWLDGENDDNGENGVQTPVAAMSTRARFLAAGRKR
jgi:hypothetical protein